MERIWNSLKRDMFRTVWKSLDAMEAATTRVLVNSCCEHVHGPASGRIFKLKLVLSLLLPSLVRLFIC